MERDIAATIIRDDIRLGDVAEVAFAQRIPPPLCA